MNHSLTRRATVPFLLLFLLSLCPAPALAAPGLPMPPGIPDDQPAATKISKDQALAIITSYFGRLSGPGTLEPRLNQNGGRSVWDFLYTVRRENSSITTSIASVDAETGRVLNYHANSPVVRQPRTGTLGPAYPQSMARSWAWALVRDLYPEVASQLTASTEENRATANTYVFTWVLTHDGLAVNNRNVRVTMERDTLNYVGLDQTLDAPVTFVGGTAKVSPDEAMQSFAAVEPQLMYQLLPLPYDSLNPLPTGKPQAALVYSYYATPISADMGMPIVPASPAATPEPLPPAAAPANPAASLPMTQDQTVAMIKTLLDAPESAQVRVSTPTGGPTGSNPDVIAINLTGPNGYYGSAIIDLRRGRVQNAERQAHSFDPGPVPAPTADQKAQAKAVAIGLVQRLYPGLSSQLRVVEAPPFVPWAVSSTINFVFGRYQGDIPVANNQIAVSIDAATLKLQSVSVSWLDYLTFPDPDGAISTDTARKVFLDGRKAQLAWLEDWTTDPTSVIRSPYTSPRASTLRLAYVLSAPATPFTLVDALTGKPIQARDSETALVPDTDKVLTGHRAEGELRYLLELGVIAPKALNPDAAITRGDALQLFMNGRRFPFNRDYFPGTDPVPYTDVAPETALDLTVQSALSAGILTPQGEKPTFQPDGQLTRAEFAVWVARSLGLGKLARSGLKTDAPSGLTDPEQRNAVAFLEALGILSGGDYAAPLTQADAAAMTVRLVLYNQAP